ncbi:MAG: sulfatase-like hydrolase/transferase, partial [Candidatus Promineifilaceae bacterium]
PKHADTLQAMRQRTTDRVKQYGGPLDPLKGNFAASTVPHPEASAAVTVKPGKDGFVHLFNGKNLNGWEGDSKY